MLQRALEEKLVTWTWTWTWTWTRISFVYLIGYLLTGGIGLITAPVLATELLQSSGSYPSALLRMVGALLCALGILVLQIVRHEITTLYRTTLLVRLVIIAVLVVAHVESNDPMFLVLTGIVGLGVVLTGVGIVTDRR